MLRRAVEQPLNLDERDEQDKRPGGVTLWPYPEYPSYPG
jgi:hypothetical protein